MGQTSSNSVDQLPAKANGAPPPSPPPPAPEPVARTINPETLTLNEYQDLSRTTAAYPKIQLIIDGGAPIDADWLYPLLGLMGEAGELCEKLKKLVRDDAGKMTPERHAACVKELGDTDWYRARLADAFGQRLGQVGAGNLAKLFDRKERGVLKGSGDNR